MKVEVKTKLEEKENEFPKLMISHDGLLIFFIEEKKGILLNDPQKEYEDVGIHYAENWSMTYFTDFKGSITITQ